MTELLTAPTDVVKTPAGDKTLAVCKDGTSDNHDWVKIYDASFPPDQRQGLDDIRKGLEEGIMELDETRDQDGNIMCMTITEVFTKQRGLKVPPFLLACYTAVVPDMRGCGIGSIHRKKLGQLLKREYPGFVGLFSEIESTRVSGLADDVMQTRVRRKNFFMRLGLLPLDVDYVFPSYEASDKPIHGELLWVPFGEASIPPPMLAAVIKRIYIEGYNLDPENELISKVTGPLTKSK